MIRRNIFIFVLLIICVIIETALLSNIIFLPAVPDLLLITVLFISIHNGSLSGETSGFFSGLILDFLSAAPLGLNCLLRTVIGFCTGLFRNILNIEGILIPAVMGFSATLLKAVLLVLISFFYPAGIITYDLFSVTFITELILNTILTPVLFSLLDLFSSFLIISPEKVYK